MKTLEQLNAELHEAAHKFDQARKKYLSAAGWVYNSKNPGGFWMWQKVLPDGRVILCDEDHAVRAERHLIPAGELPVSETEGNK